MSKRLVRSLVSAQVQRDKALENWAQVDRQARVKTMVSELVSSSMRRKAQGGLGEARDRAVEMATQIRSVLRSIQTAFPELKQGDFAGLDIEIANVVTCLQSWNPNKKWGNPQTEALSSLRKVVASALQKLPGREKRAAFGDQPAPSIAPRLGPRYLQQLRALVNEARRAAQAWLNSFQDDPAGSKCLQEFLATLNKLDQMLRTKNASASSVLHAVDAIVAGCRRSHVRTAHVGSETPNYAAFRSVFAFWAAKQRMAMVQDASKGLQEAEKKLASHKPLQDVPPMKALKEASALLQGMCREAWTDIRDMGKKPEMEISDALDGSDAEELADALESVDQAQLSKALEKVLKSSLHQRLRGNTPKTASSDLQALDSLLAGFGTSLKEIEAVAPSLVAEVKNRSDFEAATKKLASMVEARGKKKRLKKKRKKVSIEDDPWCGRKPSFDSAYKKVDGARAQLARLMARLADGSLVRGDVRYALSMLEKVLEAMRRC